MTWRIVCNQNVELSKICKWLHQCFYHNHCFHWPPQLLLPNPSTVFEQNCNVEVTSVVNPSSPEEDRLWCTGTRYGRTWGYNYCRDVPQFKLLNKDYSYYSWNIARILFIIMVEYILDINNLTMLAICSTEITYCTCRLSWVCRPVVLFLDPYVPL